MTGNSPKIKNLGQVLFAMLFAIFSFGIGSFFIWRSWEECKVDAEFGGVGISTNGRLIGFQHLDYHGKSWPSGDFPLISYTANDGQKYVHLAIEYGEATSYTKRTLPNQRITITFLPKRPDQARVRSWYTRNGNNFRDKIGFVLGAFVWIVGLRFLVGAMKYICTRREPL